MRNVEYIKRKIKKLYETNPNIHINVSLPRTKESPNNISAVIKSVYPNFFRIEENSSGYLRSHSIQYVEVLIGQVQIFELSQYADK